jgi:hypothetical protein
MAGEEKDQIGICSPVDMILVNQPALCFQEFKLVRLRRSMATFDQRFDVAADVPASRVDPGTDECNLHRHVLLGG